MVSRQAATGLTSAPGAAPRVVSLAPPLPIAVSLAVAQAVLAPAAAAAAAVAASAAPVVALAVCVSARRVAFVLSLPGPLLPLAPVLHSPGKHTRHAVPVSLFTTSCQAPPACYYLHHGRRLGFFTMYLFVI